MCGRYSLVKKSIPKEHRYAAKFAGIEPQPTYNAAPSQLLPILPLDSRLAEFFYWGLLPAWAKDMKMHRPINARAETLTTNGMFRNLLSRKRCLVPADGFYEWQVQSQQQDMFGNPGAPKGKPKKQPFRIALKNDELFSFAGLFDAYVDKATGEEIKTFTIITTEANELVKPIHDRMPVILTPEAEEVWLNKDEKDVTDLLKPYAADQMKAFPISNLINSPTNNTPEVLNSF